MQKLADYLAQNKRVKQFHVLASAQLTSKISWLFISMEFVWIIGIKLLLFFKHNVKRFLSQLNLFEARILWFANAVLLSPFIGTFYPSSISYFNSIMSCFEAILKDKRRQDLSNLPSTIFSSFQPSLTMIIENSASQVTVWQYPLISPAILYINVRPLILVSSGLQGPRLTMHTSSYTEHWGCWGNCKGTGAPAWN